MKGNNRCLEEGIYVENEIFYFFQARNTNGIHQYQLLTNQMNNKNYQWQDYYQISVSVSRIQNITMKNVNNSSKLITGAKFSSEK